jgi:autotransporter passenger strand-loop-strand repeat protein
VLAGVQIIETGGTASGTTIKAGGLAIVESGSVLSGTTTVTSGGAIEFIGTDASNNGLKLLSGATGELGPGAFLSGAQISKGVTLIVLAGGTAFGGTISAGALAIVENGGAVSSDGGGNPLTIGSGGTFEFLGTNAGANIKPLSGATLEVGSGAAFAVNNISAGITVKVLSGAALTLSGATISTGTLVETFSSGTIIVSGALADSGTLIASGPGSLIEIASGGVVSGGAVVVGNGLVDVLAGGSANIAFLAAGSGGLAIEDSPSNVSAFTGAVSGFGGMNHTNHKQFIDLTSVGFASGQIHLSYTSAAGSGTLSVMGGVTLVAQIKMIGSYTSANFSAKADNNGNVEIADPTVPNGGSVAPEPRQALPQHGIDLPDIAFGAQTTLAYTRNAAGTSGLLTVATAATRRRLRSSAATSPEASLLPPTAMAAP